VTPHYTAAYINGSERAWSTNKAAFTVPRTVQIDDHHTLAAVVSTPHALRPTPPPEAREINAMLNSAYNLESILSGSTSPRKQSLKDRRKCIAVRPKAFGGGGL
jgi:hypothetical protein